MTYSEKLKDPRWQKLRLRVFERDGWKCRDCGSEAKSLQVHHCVYNGQPWEASMEDLLTVCESCHEERQKLESSIKSTVGRIFSKVDKRQLCDMLLDFECALGVVETSGNRLRSHELPLQRVSTNQAAPSWVDEMRKALE